MTEIHVVSFFGNWAVMITGKDTPVSTHNIKDDAIRIATQLIKRHNSKLIIEDEKEKKSRLFSCFNINADTATRVSAF
jgi:hypothetical protein